MSRNSWTQPIPVELSRHCNVSISFSFKILKETSTNFGHKQPPPERWKFYDEYIIDKSINQYKYHVHIWYIIIYYICTYSNILWLCKHLFKIIQKIKNCIPQRTWNIFRNNPNKKPSRNPARICRPWLWNLEWIPVAKLFSFAKLVKHE